MRILFFSKTCDFCLKLLEYIDKNNLGEFFKLICIDTTNNIPKNIHLVPTIIDTDIEAQLEGKKAFEYVINQKYFNHPTNNIDYIKNGVPKPKIEEDKKAFTSKHVGFIYVDNNDKEDIKDTTFYSNFDNKNKIHDDTNDNKLINVINQRDIQDKKMNALMRLRK
jgi:hypothetical protein